MLGRKPQTRQQETNMPDTIDFGAVTARQQATWASGDFHVVARQVMTVSEDVVATADPAAGSRVLDVACGSGNAALVAARRYCEVTGIDYVPALLERARARAAAELLPVIFKEADAQALPFADGAFDTVVSVFGAMFAPDQEKTARELARVCRPGGRIAMATWDPAGYGGVFFKLHAKYVPPPPGLKPALRWGTQDGINELLGPWTKDLRVEKRWATFYFKSIPHFIDEFEKWFGPTVRVLETVDAAGRAAFEKELADAIAPYNQAKDGTAKIVADYTHVIATRNDQPA
jgi:ubiquinone/menaquinone biosynthesis C-methylase UbiE